MTLEQLPDAWRDRADLIRPYAEASATAFEEAARELEDLLRDRENELLNLRQGAKASGYSDDHLGHLIRIGKLTNYGKRGAPKVRRGDLPKKATGAQSSLIKAVS